ncbi:MAG: hypothetical protein IKE89_02280 [Bacilli bacterium]|nr:hypothetical protein [Bacilli bacterium]
MKESYIKLPNITVGKLQDVVDFLDYNNIEYIEDYKRDEEIERLNKQIEEYQKALDETTSEKIELANIINEVREYVYKWKDIGRYRLLEMLGSDKE